MQPIDLDPVEPVRTWSLPDSLSDAVATFVSEPDGGGYLAVTHGDPEDATKPFVRLRVELADEDYAELVRLVAGPAAERHHAEREREEAAHREHQAAIARRDSVRVFELHGSVGNRNGPTTTVHLKTCGALRRPLNERNPEHSRDAAEVMGTNGFARRWDVLTEAVKREQKVAAPSGVEGNDWMPLRFCERCKPLGDATTRSNRELTRIAYRRGGVDYVAELERAHADISTYLWDTEKRLLLDGGVIS